MGNSSFAAARQHPEEKAVDKLAEANPLFAEEIRSGEMQPDKRQRAR